MIPVNERPWDIRPDGLIITVRLTPKGKRAADAATVSSSQALSAVLDKINRGERQKVLDALEALAKVMDGDVPGGA